MSAKEYNIRTRVHWAIESMHYVKDVIFGEDASLITCFNLYVLYISYNTYRLKQRI